MTVDRYAGTARRWASGATLVYGPIAAQLVDTSPHPLAGRRVLDAGAGTGAATTALLAHGACPVATDLSLDMLRCDAGRRPPGAVADLRALPFAGGAVDDVVAAFVLNHLVDPEAGMAELMRVTRPGGAFLAAVFGTANRSEARERIDAVALDAGWRPPAWYLETKATAVPLLGDPASMAAAARACRLEGVLVDERRVDVGVTEPEQLVRYRLGQAPFSAWLDGLGPDGAEQMHRRAADAVRPHMPPYRPLVVFLAARVPAGRPG